MPSVSPTALTEFAAALFEKAGTSRDHAVAIAEVLVWASVRGVDSHGVSRVPRYLELLASGEANPHPNIEVHNTRSAVAVVEADRAPGPVALRMAADLAVDLAKACGVGTVGVRRTVHTGAIGYYTKRIADAGMVGIAFVAGMPNMGYTGVKGAAVATSPLSVAVPGDQRAPVLLDMATATIALGKIAQHRNSGTPLPAGAAATADGTPTTDPTIATMPLPLGGAKGSGMSLAFELITSVLVGAPILADFHSGVDRKHRQNALLVAVDPAAFGNAEFTSQVDDTVSALKTLPTADGVDEVLVPGERSAAIAARRLDEGVPVSPKIWAQLTEAAETRGVPLPPLSKTG
jgi:ureidoglycolate dehydrogenase (NAD+)